jgi:hypothetical protein
MKYKITKEQYTRVVNKIINTFFKGVEFNPTHPDYEDYKSLDFSVGGKDLGWIIGPPSSMLTKKCKYELVIYTDTIDEMKDFAPLFRKKLFAKLIIAHFSKLTGLDINCLYMDEFGDGDEDDAYKYRIKKKKK